MNKLLCAVLGSALLLGGCITNELGDPQKRRQIQVLSSESEKLLEQIDMVLIDKDSSTAQLKNKIQELNAEFEEAHEEHSFYLSQVEEGLKVTIIDRVLFAPGQAVLSKKGRKVLLSLAPVLAKAEEDIQVSGFTDNQPVRKVKHKYKSNWELSSARALSVLKFFAAQGVPEKKMHIVAFGQFSPIDDNRTKKGRANNRRVEIILLKSLPRSEG